MRACLLVSVSIATMAQAQAQVPVIVEAESGSLGSNLTTGVDTAAGVNYITVVPLTSTANPPTADRIATYQVVFPAAGSYALYARILIFVGWAMQKH